ncbi:HK97-gp10 family putative phage morphogenesis protein [Alkalihalobacterium alkalinitrilicum]|uniref:HK97-gp10 family putative phage morphogenesis protein n=1 Tax=Alkalihalobacterium alkalinitrilicum TaxID=427920 RepID=UPI000995BC6D|nr:HK97-gp10 family putative phage morphogenesis protein [Alkalihalobacterium alkalinitrilicum]
MKINIKVNGLDKLQKELKRYAKEKPEGLKKIVAETAVSVEGGAIARAPVDTGNLKNSMGIRFENDGATAEVFNSANYSQWVEYGSYKAAAQPFLYPSWEQQSKNYMQALINEMKKV